LLDARQFRNNSNARLAIFYHIEGVLNVRRRHTSIGTISPVIFEHHYYESNENNEPIGRLLERFSYTKRPLNRSYSAKALSKSEHLEKEGLPET